MNNLFYVNQQIADIISEFVDSDGVIADEGMAILSSLEMKKDDLIDSMIKAHKNQQVMIDGIDAELTRLKLRKETYLKTQQSLMTAITPYLTEGEKIETAEYILKWTTSSPLVGLEGFDPELSWANKNDELHTYVIKKEVEPSYSFDKNLIKKALKKEVTARELPNELYINTIKNPKIT